MDEKGMCSFNGIALLSPSPLEDEGHISRPQSPNDKAVSRQESTAPYIDYEGLVDFITNRYITTSLEFNSTGSPSSSSERSMDSFSSTRTGSGSFCDKGHDILQNLQPKTLNFRIIDPEKPTLDFVCAEHDSKMKLEVLPMQADKFLAQTGHFDVIKSSSSTSTDSFFACEELEFPHDCGLSSRSISTHAEPAASKNAPKILNIDGQLNQEDKRRLKKSKKNKKEAKKEIKTAANNFLTGREAYDEEQHAEKKRCRAKSKTKKEDLKDRKTSQVSTDAEMKHERREVGLVTNNDRPKTLTVRTQSVVSHLCLGRDHHDRENFGNEIEDKFKNDDAITFFLSEAKQTDFKNATGLSFSNTVQQSHTEGKKKSHVENAQRQRVPSKPKERVLNKDTFTLPQIVSETTEPLQSQSRRAKNTTKHTHQTKNPSTHALRLPPIEKNNFAIAKNSMEIHSRETSHTIGAQSVLPKKNSEFNWRLENQHWGQSASNTTDSSRLKSSVQRKSMSRYDRDILENRAKGPPFETRCDTVHVKVRFPQI
jgi:hypothetical protein